MTVALLTGLQPAMLRCQLVCIPASICACENETVAPNLTVSRPVKLTGTLKDPTGAPIRYQKSSIQVRNAKGGKVISSTSLDEKGTFSLGIVPAGEFRLIAFWEHDRKISRLPLFDQPKPEICPGDKECHLDIVLAVHGTDQRFEFCPPK